MVDEQGERAESMEAGQSGHLHPISILIREITQIFDELGFSVAHGPEIESEFYNFDALNFPPDHPSRDLQDTFWIKGERGNVLRTQTSPIQVRYMETHEPPFRLIASGRTFRNEATDATHDVQFYQCEGLLVDDRTSLAELKGTLDHFLKRLFGDDVETRLRPGFFPFVEPGVEVDMRCMRCSSDGCSACKQSGWIEVLGAGMVHPNVLNASGVDWRKWRGFAFGIGLDRLAMLRWGIDDIRSLYAGDLRVINQF